MPHVDIGALDDALSSLYAVQKQLTDMTERWAETQSLLRETYYELPEHYSPAAQVDYHTRVKKALALDAQTTV